METRLNKHRFGTIFTKTIKSTRIYRPSKTSAIADICFDCPYDDCKKGFCDRFREKSREVRKKK